MRARMLPALFLSCLLVVCTLLLTPIAADAVERQGEREDLRPFDPEAPPGATIGLPDADRTDDRAGRFGGRDLSDAHWWDGFGNPHPELGPNARVVCALSFEAELVIGGDFTAVPGAAAAHVAGWDGSAWHAFGDGLNDRVAALAAHGGELYVGGEFRWVNGSSRSYIARWDGERWRPVGAGFDGPVYALAVYDGRLIAGGDFDHSGPSDCAHIAAWDGAQWVALGEGSDDVVRALAVHDGALYVGGDFSEAGTASADHIARWNGRGWSAVGDGFNGSVWSLASYAGQLHAGGAFTASGAQAASGIAVWDGADWQPLGAGIEGPTSPTVYALHAYGGELIAGGRFETAAGIPARMLACWDGAAWRAPGSQWTIEVPFIQALCTYDGELIAGGGFAMYVPGCRAERLAAWTGAQAHPEAWHGIGPAPVAGLGLSHQARCMLVDQDRLLVAGDFLFAGPTFCRRIAAWDGATWSPLPIDFDNSVYALAREDDRLLAGGAFTQAGALAAAHVALRDGESWQALGLGVDGIVYDVAFYEGAPIAAGNFASVNGGANEAHGIARWNGSAWEPIGDGLAGGSVLALAVYQGDLIAGGNFTASGETEIPMLARWDGEAWTPVGGGLYVQNPYCDGVHALLVDRGSLYAGGRFKGVRQHPDDPPEDHLHVWSFARFDGEWHALGRGLGAHEGAGDCSYVLDIAIIYGAFYVAGQFEYADGLPAQGVARWDEPQWSPVGSGGWNGLGTGVGTFISANPTCLAAFGRQLYVGGRFLRAGDKDAFAVGRWDPLPPAFGEFMAPGPGAALFGDGLREAVWGLSALDASSPRIEVYDVSGRLVQRIASPPGAEGGILAAEARTHACGLGSGVYYVREHLPAGVRTRRLIVVR